MLQTLLTERFKLTASHHPRELTVYALVIAKGGPKLRVTGTPRPTEPHLEGTFLMAMTQDDVPVSALAIFLSSHFGRTVIDGTGLTGRYDISFAVPIPEDHAPEAADSSVFTALEDQLGLKLVSRKEVVDTIVIDHLEHPSDN
jgi:uncharacterized protein (TIGR03435 family)